MRFYRLLLHLYPASFRHEYGAEMSDIFSEHRQRVRGAWPVLALWLETTLEILRDAARVHGDILTQDMKYAARTFTHSLGFAVTVIIVSAMGIGATTAVFSLADHVLIRPLPFPESNRLAKILERPPGYIMELSPANYRDWKRLSTSFGSMGAYTDRSANLTGGGEPERLEGAMVTAEIFPMLRVPPLLGRYFAPDDDREGAPGTLVLSYGLWQRRFGGDREVLGKQVSLDNKPFTVIGVMPSTFYFPSREDEFWRTFCFRPEDYADRNDNFIYGVGRLHDGVSLEQARTEMSVVAAQLEKQFPKENKDTGAIVYLLHDELSDQARLLLMALAGASLCVLLIACTNVANLMLARALARRKELAVRTALGAGRERLVRQLLTESITLAALGGALGVALAWFALPLLTRLVPHSLPIAEIPALDLRVLSFAAVITLATGIGFGVAPALRLPADANASGLREGDRGGVGGRKQRLRAALVVTEVMASVVLLACSGLLIRALWKLQGVDPGFRTEGVLTARTWLPFPKYESTERRQQFYSQVLSEVRALPGVTSAGYISFLPMTMRGGIWPVSLDGQAVQRAGDVTASLRFITPSFFETMNIPLKSGRNMNDGDTRQSLFVAVVSESFVNKFFPGQNPLGRTFTFAFSKRTIVGVVGNVRVRGIERNSEPQVYLPAPQVDDGSLIGYTPKDLVLHTTMNPVTLIPAIRQIVKRVDPEQPLSDIRTMEEIVAAETATRRTQLGVLGTFSGVAILLAGIGIYGLLAFAVSQRTQEIGVRIALGAQRGSVLRLILRDVTVLALTGTALGLVVALAAGRSLAALLVGVSAADAATMLSVVGLTVLVTMLGSLVPALRAVRVDPVIALRAE